jgi:hypothetical protein
VALRRGSVSPYSGGTVPESHRVPFPLAGIGRELIIGRVPRSRAVRVWLPVVRGRHASPVDVAIDTVGVLAGLALRERIRAR